MNKPIVAAPPAAPARTSRARRVLRRLLAAVGIVFVALATLELWLRANAQSPPRPNVAAPTRRRVLCVGDSYTYGVGAPRGESYPDHLRQLLGAGWAVVNEGWPGANSSVMSERLPTWLDEAQPDVVLVMAGMNNRHNPLGGTYRRLVAAGYVQPSRWEALAHTLDVALWHLRVYRLVRWTVADRLSRAPAPTPRAAPAGGVGLRAGTHWSAQAASDPGLSSAMHDAARALERGDRAGALRTLRAAFEGLRSCDQVSEPFINQLRELRARLPREDYASLTATLRARLPAGDYAVCIDGPFFLEGDAALQQKMLWYDLEQMRVASARAGAQMVILTYPWRMGSYEEVQVRFAMLHRLPLITPTLPPWYSMTELAAPNARLSGAGNRWLAGQVLEQGRALGLFPGSQR